MVDYACSSIERSTLVSVYIAVTKEATYWSSFTVYNTVFRKGSDVEVIKEQNIVEPEDSSVIEEIRDVPRIVKLVPLLKTQENAVGRNQEVPLLQTNRVEVA